MSGISEERLVGMSALCQGVCADMEGTPQNCLRDLIAEIRRLRTENAELKKKMALLTSDKRDLIEEMKSW